MVDDDEESLEGEALGPSECISHITIPSSLPGSFTSPLRLIQHSCSTAAASHSSSTWKQQKLDFILIFAADVDVTSKGAEHPLKYRD